MVPALLQLGTLSPSDAMFSPGASTSKSSFALVLSGRDLHLRELGIGWVLVGNNFKCIYGDKQSLVKQASSQSQSNNCEVMLLFPRVQNMRFLMQR